MIIPKCAIIVRRSGAYGLGHVGWMFNLPDGNYVAGAVENPKGTPVCAPAEMGFWNVVTQNPSHEFIIRGYDAFKMFSISSPNPKAALDTVKWISEQPYNVMGQNCMDDTYDVIHSFGAVGIPKPFNKVTPNAWFDSFNYPVQSLTPKILLSAFDTADIGSINTEHWTNLSTYVATGKAPLWRQPGTREYESLNKELEYQDKLLNMLLHDSRLVINTENINSF